LVRVDLGFGFLIGFRANSDGSAGSNRSIGRLGNGGSGKAFLDLFIFTQGLFRSVDDPLAAGKTRGFGSHFAFPDFFLLQLGGPFGFDILLFGRADDGDAFFTHGLASSD